MSALAALGLLGAWLACAPRTVAVEGASPRPDPRYGRVHVEQTRELKLYDQLETQLILRATWRGEAQRRAAVAELAWRGSMTTDEQATLLQAELAELAAAHEVVFASMFSSSAGTPDPPIFGDALDSPWRLRLDVDGQPCPLLSVDQVDDPSAAQALLYPQLNAWSQLWIARFDRSCGSAGTARLVVSGSGGSGALTWALPPAG